MCLQNCSSDCCIASKTHPLQIIGDVSDHFCNFPKPTIFHLYAFYAIMIGQLVKKFALVFHSLHNYLWYFSCKHQSATVRMSSRRLRHPRIIPVFKEHCIPPFSLKHVVFSCTFQNETNRSHQYPPLSKPCFLFLEPLKWWRLWVAQSKHSFTTRVNSPRCAAYGMVLQRTLLALVPGCWQ